MSVNLPPPPFPQSMSPDWWLNTHNNYAQKGSAFGFWLLYCPSSPPLTVGVRFLIIIVSENFGKCQQFFLFKAYLLTAFQWQKFQKIFFWWYIWHRPSLVCFLGIFCSAKERKILEKCGYNKLAISDPFRGLKRGDAVSNYIVLLKII